MVKHNFWTALVLAMVYAAWAQAAWAQEDDGSNEPLPIRVENAADVTLYLALTGGHADEVNAVAFSPDGARIASAGEDTALVLWDAASGEQLAVSYEHFSFIKSVDFHPQDADRLLTGSWDRTLIVWDLSGDTPAVAEMIQGAPAVVEDASYSPDAALLAYGVGDGTARVYDLAAGEEQHRFRLDSLQVTDVVFSPDGQMLAAAGGFPDTHASLFDLDRGTLAFQMLGHDGGVLSLAFNPDGTLLVSGGDDSVLIFWPIDQDTNADDETLTVERRADTAALFPLPDWPVELAFSPDGMVLAVALADGTIQLWDVALRELLVTFTAHDGMVNAVVFNPQGTRLASAGSDGLVMVWAVGAPAADAQ